MIELWPFQDRIVGHLRSAIRKGYRRILLVSPTGSGKTVMFAYLVSRMAQRAVASNIMVHRQELVEQVSRTLSNFGSEHSFIAADQPYFPSLPIQVSSVFTLVRRLEKTAVPSYAICDEAHHCILDSTWHQCLAGWEKQNPNLITIGVTATPQRLSGEGLGAVFDHMIVGPSVGELIDDGYLSQYKIFAPPQQIDTSQLRWQAGDYKRSEAEALVNRPTITGNAVAHYRKYLDGRPTVAFCVSVKHAQMVAEDFRAAGYRAASIDGSMDKKDRAQMVRDFSSGQISVMTSCQLINEGFDVPGMHGAILLNPTESLAKYLQECGRALRKCDSKEFAYILDHVGNSSRHGLPCDQREWSLDSKKRKKTKRDPDDIAIRQCGVCGAVSGANATVCLECNTPFPVKPRKIEEIEGELSEVERKRQIRERKMEQGQAGDLEALIELGIMRGMKNPHGWARHVMDARNKKASRRYGNY